MMCPEMSPNKMMYSSLHTISLSLTTSK